MLLGTDGVDGVSGEGFAGVDGVDGVAGVLGALGDSGGEAAGPLATAATNPQPISILQLVFLNICYSKAYHSSLDKRHTVALADGWCLDLAGSREG